MAMGTEASVPSAPSTRHTTTSPARASTPDLSDRTFSLMVLPVMHQLRSGPGRGGSFEQGGGEQNQGDPQQVGEQEMDELHPDGRKQIEVEHSSGELKSDQGDDGRGEA